MALRERPHVKLGRYLFFADTWTFALFPPDVAREVMAGIVISSRNWRRMVAFVSRRSFIRRRGRVCDCFAYRAGTDTSPDGPTWGILLMTIVDAQAFRRFEEKKQSWTGTGRSGIQLDEGKDSYYVVTFGSMKIDGQP